MNKNGIITYRSLLTGFILLMLIACDNHRQNLALGTLERDRIAHTATTSEVVISLPIAQGSMVEKGSILVALDDTQQKTQVAKAQAQVAQAKANLEKLRKGAREEEIAMARATVAGYKATLIENEANYQRLLSIAKKDFASRSNLDQALAARDANLANLHGAQERLRELITGTRIEDLHIAEAKLDADIATLAGEEKKLSDLTIRATRSGRLDSLPWNLGERVTMGSPVAVILAGNAPFARVYVPEPYRVKLQVNDKLVVHVDGLEKPFLGTLRWIANEPAFTPYYALNQQERSRLMYLAEVQLPEDGAQLPSGVPAQVELP